MRKRMSLIDSRLIRYDPAHSLGWYEIQISIQEINFMWRNSLKIESELLGFQLNKIASRVWVST